MQDFHRELLFTNVVDHSYLAISMVVPEQNVLHGKSLI